MAEFSDDDVEVGSAPQFSDDDVETTQTFSDDDVTPVTASPMGSAVRRALIEAPVGVAAGVGMVGGAAAGALTSPVTGPVGPFVGGAAGGIGAGMAAQKGEDWLLEKLGLNRGGGFFSDAQRLADERQNPKASFTGELAGNILPSFGVGAGKMLGQRAVGAVLQGGLEAGQEAYQGEDIDPAKVTIAAGAGVAFPQARGWVNRLASQAGRLGKNPDVKPDVNIDTEGQTTDPNGPNYNGRGGGGAALDGEVLPPNRMTGDPKIDAELENAYASRDGFTQGDPLHRFWDDYIGDLLSRGDGKASAGLDVDATYGPAGDQNPFTYRDADKANDVTTVAKGIATENSPVPLVVGAGNPVGAPMQARIAARPSEPLRDYRKDRPQLPAPTQTQESVALSTADMHEDVAAALKPDEPQTTFQQKTVNPGQQAAQPAPAAPTPTQSRAPQAPATNPQQLVQQATQHAMRRPIVETPMPSGANSSKDMNGPVYVDPSVPQQLRRPVAVHETVEQSLMAQGMPYAKAHEIATHAEEQAVRAAGMDVNQYRQQWDKVLAHVENQPYDPAHAPQDMHVDPEQAIGHYAPRHAGAGVTPQAQKVIDTAMATLKERGFKQVLDKMVSLPPEQQAQMGSQILHALQSESGEAKGTAGEVTLPRAPRKTDTGVGYRSLADKARKEGSLKAIDNAIAAFRTGDQANVIPTSVSDKKELISRLQQMVDHATAANGGTDPVSSYKPRVKPPSYLVMKAAQSVLAKPTPANIRSYYAAEKALGGEGAAESAKDFQDTGRIQADIDKRQSIPDAAAEAQLNKAQEGNQSRPQHDTFDNAEGDESAIYTGEQNRLRDWLNGLSDEDHAHIMKANPEIETDLQTTQDPGELMRNYMDDLADAQGKRPGVIERVPAEDLKGKPQRVTSRTELDRFAPTEAGQAAGAGKKLDRNSPEFKAAAEAALKATPKVKLDADELAALNSKTVRDEAIDGSDRSFLAKLHSFAGDEAGAIPIPKPLQWMSDRIHDFWDPQAPHPLVQYGEDLGGDFTKMRNRITEYKGKLLANVAATKKLTLAEFGQQYRAAEDGATGRLPTDLKDHFDTYSKPLLAEYGPKYDELKQIMDQYQLPGHDTMPERGDVYQAWMQAIRNQEPGWQAKQARLQAGEKFKSWVPRLGKGQSWEDVGNNDVLAQKGDTLSTFATTAQPREYFSLQNPNGMRVTVVPGAGQFTILRNGAPQIVKVTSNSFDPTRIGDTDKFKINGQNTDWTVDHATIDEIKAAAGRNTDGTFKEDYHDNPPLVLTNALYGLNNALERARMYRDIVEDPLFQANSATSKRAEPRIDAEGWIKPRLPQFDDTYMPKPLAWALDDFHKPGLPIDGRAKTLLDRTAAAGTKLFYFLGPGIHMMNEADKWAIGRGFNWITPQGTRSLVTNGAKALQSVWTQNALQDEMRKAGMNPMYLHTATTEFMPQVADRLGIEIQRNPKAWDPIARIWNTTTPELAKALYKKSTGAMWWVTDVFATQRYLEEKELRGLSPEEAGKSAHDFVDSYVMPSTLGGKGDMGRLARQFLTDPSTSLFSSYHLGVFASFANMTKGLIQRNKTPGDRARAAGQMLTAAGMIWGLYPLLSAGYRAVTGSENSEVEPRGMSRIAQTGIDVAQGKKGVQDALRNVYTPSVLADTLTRQFQNKDFAGKDIIPELDYTQPHNLKTGAARELDFLTGQFASPVKGMANEFLRRGSTPGSVGQKLIESQIGVKTPTPAAEKREWKLPSILQKNERQGMKKPGGLFEDLLNRL